MNAPFYTIERYQPTIAPQSSALFSTQGALRPLRPHQERAPEALRRSLASGHRRPLLQAPTGFGKTLTAEHIIQRALDKGNRVIFTVSVNFPPAGPRTSTGNGLAFGPTMRG
jgi:superfamily II DNA or RNA helicase